MDDKNVDILLKKRSEEIKKKREAVDSETPVVEENQAHCVDEQTVQDTIVSIKKVQRTSIIWKLAVLILVIALSVLWFNNMSLQETIEDLELEVLSLLDGGASHTYMGDTIPSEYLLMVDNRILIHADFVMEQIDTNIHYSNSGTRVYIPLEQVDYVLETKEVTDYVKENIVDINIPILTKNGHNYIDFEVLKKLYGLDLMVATDGSYAIYDQTFDGLRKVASNISFVKTSHGMNVVDESDPVQISAIVIDTHEDLSKIITETGRTGFVKTVDLENYTVDILETQLNDVRPAHDYGENVNMTWSQISEYKNNPNLRNDETIPGLDAISPTWFSLNINGIIINEADFRYMKDAQDKGYEVWGLFNNSFKPSWTSEMLNDPVYRKRAIAQIAFYAALYDLDGVNIDFENMYLDDKEKFTQFMAELSPVMEAQNVTLSIAVTVPGGSDQWSKVFDRENIVKHVDYMMLMAYDEFWGSSPVSGPVASIPWVEKGIKETLELVPNEKLILGIPLYMRVWKESGVSVDSTAFGIKHLEGLLDDVDYESSYDEENFLNYVSYRKDDLLHRIWLEDESSINKRITLAKKYKLPGIGSWSKEFVEMETWEYINNILDR
ncbi:hypothetical protein EZV73_15665 [Acidaminobacter sp. JC074]|uniref:glycosyl hydrolase family 18 protein n=1 Tax=Acidaminobacter sp. JC074 TaxID=2530199 RepID=UPI001F103B63|nr:glycosyl hydrolase family 18 protein [Acidaminobacter sp. JC074]MCH4889032.1 hypothetical protein [Acidaminobacter sp. JC074]